MCREGAANLDTVSTDPDGSISVIDDSPVRRASHPLQSWTRVSASRNGPFLQMLAPRAADIQRAQSGAAKAYLLWTSRG